MPKDTMRCLFKSPGCSGHAESKEHVKNNSRRQFLRNKGADLGSEKARFRGITCKECNEFLGQLENKYWSFLAMATMWKIIAGNLNDVFDRAEWAKTKVTDRHTLEVCSDGLSDALKKSKVFLPNNMLGYGLVYSVTGDSDGKCSVEVLIGAESVYIIQDTINVENVSTGEKMAVEMDMLCYHSPNSNGHKMLYYLPLIGKISTPWINQKITISHRGFEHYARPYLEESGARLEELYNLFPEAM